MMKIIFFTENVWYFSGHSFYLYLIKIFLALKYYFKIRIFIPNINDAWFYFLIGNRNISREEFDAAPLLLEKC